MLVGIAQVKNSFPESGEFDGAGRRRRSARLEAVDDREAIGPYDCTRDRVAQGFGNGPGLGSRDWVDPLRWNSKGFGGDRALGVVRHEAKPHSAEGLGRTVDH